MTMKDKIKLHKKTTPHNTRRNTTRQDTIRLDKTQHDKGKEGGKERPGKTREGRERQDKARQENTIRSRQRDRLLHNPVQFKSLLCGAILYLIQCTANGFCPHT